MTRAVRTAASMIDCLNLMWPNTFTIYFTTVTFCELVFRNRFYAR